MQDFMQAYASVCKRMQAYASDASDARLPAELFMTVIEAGPGVEVALSEDESKRAGRFLQGQPSDAEALHAVDPSLASCGLRKGRVTELVIEDELESLCYQRVGSENWIREGASVPTRW